MTNSLNEVLDEHVRTVSEMTDEQLDGFILSLERAYVHATIEHALRNPVRVSPAPKRSRRP